MSNIVEPPVFFIGWKTSIAFYVMIGFSFALVVTSFVAITMAGDDARASHNFAAPTSYFIGSFILLSIVLSTVLLFVYPHKMNDIRKICFVGCQEGSKKTSY